MQYVVFEAAGKHYRAGIHDVLLVDSLRTQPNSPVTFEKVLMIVADGKTEIGKPYVSGAKVVATVISSLKGKKVVVSKFKSKVRYRRTRGFRAHQTRIQIDHIDHPLMQAVQPVPEKKTALRRRTSQKV